MTDRERHARALSAESLLRAAATHAPGCGCETCAELARRRARATSTIPSGVTCEVLGGEIRRRYVVADQGGFRPAAAARLLRVCARRLRHEDPLDPSVAGNLRLVLDEVERAARCEALRGEVSVTVTDWEGDDEPAELAPDPVVQFPSWPTYYDALVDEDNAPRAPTTVLTFCNGVPERCRGESTDRHRNNERPEPGADPLWAAAAWWGLRMGPDDVEDEGWRREFAQLARERLASADPLEVSTVPAPTHAHDSLPDDFLREVCRRLGREAHAGDPGYWFRAATRVWRSGRVEAREGDGPWVEIRGASR